jgi:hypothetical protein
MCRVLLRILFVPRLVHKSLLKLIRLSHHYIIDIVGVFKPERFLLLSGRWWLSRLDFILVDWEARLWWEKCQNWRFGDE